MNGFLNQPRTVLLMISFIFSCSSFSQTALYQNLYFIKKGNQTVTSKKDYLPGDKGFYVYRNCIYDLVLKNKKEISANVIDIRNDSIYYTNYVNQNVADKYNDHLDTLYLHPSEIKKFRMISDRAMSLYQKYNLNNYEYHFEYGEEAKKFPVRTQKVYSMDSSQATDYELVPHLAAEGMDVIYEKCGDTYYFQGDIGGEECEQSDTSGKSPLIKKIVWFTPSTANEIRGVTLGFQTWNVEDAPLTVRGVNLNIDMASMIACLVGLFKVASDNALINLPDSVKKSGPHTTVHGLSLSLGGLLVNGQRGISINGGIFIADHARGLVITGTQNLTGDFHGIVISALRNRSIAGKGVQIGLLNICKHLDGVQIGLWNVNSKRRLPFINWSF